MTSTSIRSSAQIEARQRRWATGRECDPARPTYLTSVDGNLFGGRISVETRGEFDKGDGSEMRDTKSRPAKMRALLSSSALGVNFFDPWRTGALDTLGRALGLNGARSLQFEFKPKGYPVGPRSPNLDVLITLADGSAAAVECKFGEPFRGSAKAGFSQKYFPTGKDLWAAVGLDRCQALARATEHPRYLDVPQLLKHMLGLAHADIRHLVYLWYDTGLADAAAHRAEVDAFAAVVAGDSVAFSSATYQQVFAALDPDIEPVPGWREYMLDRYFA